MPPIPTVCHHGRVGTSGDGLSDGGYNKQQCSNMKGGVFMWEWDIFEAL